MHSITNYIVESALCLGVLTLFYYGFLRHQNIPGFGRWYLLASLVFTSVLPLVQFSLNQPSTEVQQPIFYGVMLDAVNVYGTIVYRNVVPAVQQHSEINWFYLIGFVLLVARLFHALLKLGLLKRNTKREKQGNIRVIMTEKVFQPFSFMNTVFVPKSFYKGEGAKSILAHEAVHVQQKHTFDLILLELVLLVQWFNPFVWLLRRAIVENHEFLADQAVLKSGVPVNEYQKMLLYEVMGAKFDLGTGFSYSLTNKRFKMMKTKVNNSNMIKSAFMSILLFGSVLFIAATEIYNDPALTVINEDGAEQMTKTDTTISEETVFVVVEKMPQFPGGQKALREYFFWNVDYPEIARENGIQGEVFVSYVINETGKVTNVKVTKGVARSLDAEAVRVVEAMPDWTPGEQRGKKVKVAFTIPVNFKLAEKQVEIGDPGVKTKKMHIGERSIIKQGDKYLVKAKLLDENNKAIPGASLLIPGTNKGTLTNMEGKFELILDKPDQVINISFVGMKTLSVKFGEDAANYSKQKLTIVGNTPNENEVFKIVEKMPEFPGGQKAMMKFLAENIRYPSEAQEQSIQGRVYTEFIVDKEGNIKNISIKRGVHKALDKEAVRVIKSMPQWTPGKQRGKNVNVSYVLPVNFMIHGEKSVTTKSGKDEIVVIAYNPENQKKEKLTIIEDKTDENSVFKIVEVMPKFTGGDEAMKKFIEENIKYPNDAKKNGIQGRVYVNFIVARDGSINNIKVVRGVDPALDKEAIRVIKSMPKWTPGTQRGKKVRVSYMLPISFALQ